MKQTAVEWLVDYIENQNKNGYEFHPKYNEHIVQQAKEMEKQQKGYSDEDIINALHSVELKDNKDYSKIFNGMKECFEQFKNK